MSYNPSFMSNKTYESPPITGVIVSHNALVKVGGLILLRVSDITVRYSNSVGVYTEIGERRQIPYVGAQRVSGTINRAYVNGAEWRLLIGDMRNIGRLTYKGISYPTGGQSIPNDPNSVQDTELDTGAIELNSKRSYPIHTNIELFANVDAIEQQDLPALDGSNNPAVDSDTTQAVFEVVRAMFDSGGIRYNENGLITSGPISFEAEMIRLLVSKDPLVSRDGAGTGIDYNI